MATTMTKKTLLEVNHLHVDYNAANGTVHAVNDVSFALERGEILGLAGESGSGKSTLAYAISRLLRPPAEVTGGEVFYYPRAISERGTGAGSPVVRHGKWGQQEVDGGQNRVNVMQLSHEQLRTFRWDELSIVFQSAMNALNPVMKIGDQIKDVLRAHRPQMGPDARKTRAAELLKLVGISADRLNSYPHELSGGMRQRAVIAIALALSPEIIIMDEPTTALDVVVQREILGEIVQLREQLGFSVIFITHDLSLLLELADKIAVMYAGRIVEMATCADLHAHPRHPYSYGLLNSFPTIHGPRRKMAGIPGTPPDLRMVPSGCPFHTRCPAAFNACKTVAPSLRPATGEISQLTACHLYDSRYHPGEPPATAELAARYEALAERSAKR